MWNGERFMMSDRVLSGTDQQKRQEQVASMVSVVFDGDPTEYIAARGPKCCHAQVQDSC